MGEFSDVTGDILDELWDFPGVMAQIGEGLMSSLKSLNATNLMVTKSGVGVRFTCSDVAGQYGGNAIHQFKIRLNNKLEYILQFS